MRRMKKVEKQQERSTNVEISEDGQFATRKSPTMKFDRAWVEIDKPFQVSKEDGSVSFEVMITRFQKGWSGNLKMRLVEDCEKVCDEELEVNNEPVIGGVDLEEGTRVRFVRKSNGESVYLFNGEEVGKVEWQKPSGKQTAAPTKALFGMVHVYAKTSGIRLIEPMNWSTETHQMFPKEFKKIVISMLMCHRRQDGNLVSSLSKFVLMDVFSILGGLYCVLPPLPKQLVSSSSTSTSSKTDEHKKEEDFDGLF